MESIRFEIITVYNKATYKTSIKTAQRLRY